MPTSDVSPIGPGARSRSWRRSGAACAGKTKNDVNAVARRRPPVEHVEMDPIKITAVKGPGGRPPRDLRRRRAVRAGRGGAVGEALRRRHCAPTTGCSRSSPDSRYTKAAPLQRRPRATRARRTGRAAIARFKVLSDQLRRDGRRQGRAVPARRHLRRDGNWPTSADGLREILERKDLTADDKIEALGAARLRAVPAQGPGHAPSGRSSRRCASSAASRRRSGCRPTSTWAW